MMTQLITNSLRIDLSDERIRFADSRERTIFHAPIQPCVSSCFEGAAIKLGYIAEPIVEREGICLMSWQRSDGQARLRWTFTLNGDAVITSPIEFSCARPESVESISLFAKADNTNAARPAGFAHRHIISGIGIGPEISPIQHAITGLNGRFSLGRGRGPTVHQQWGLPSLITSFGVFATSGRKVGSVCNNHQARIDFNWQDAPVETDRLIIRIQPTEGHLPPAIFGMYLDGTII